ncbi:unnamed protein product, partial [Prunus brigantina]
SDAANSYSSPFCRLPFSSSFCSFTNIPLSIRSNSHPFFYSLSATNPTQAPTTTTTSDHGL